MKANDPVDTVAHQVHRLSLDVGAAFDDFRARYARAVPMLDAARLAVFTNWDTVRQVAADAAPHGFLIYWQADVTPLMRLPGDQSLCVEYVMGNHTIAQRMFHRDPAIMLYAPLRTAIYQDARGRTRFSFDQPSTCFGSFDNPEITKVDIELDGKLAALLRHLKAPVPPALETGGVPDAGIQQSTKYGVTR
jgi:uncharacterized protein (DUF302 family)